MESTDVPAVESKIVLHHLNDSRSQRILWLLEELELPYEIKKYQREKTKQAPEALKKIYPLGKAPIISDGDTVIAESGAIVEYLIEKYGKGKLLPTTEKSGLSNLYWTHYAEGSLMPILANAYIFSLVPKRTPFIIRPFASMIFGQLNTQLIVPQAKTNAALMESHLENVPHGWFAGEEHPTSADFMMSYPLERIYSAMPELLGPKSKEYVQRIQSRPAYKRGLEKGGEYSYAKL